MSARAKPRADDATAAEPEPTLEQYRLAYRQISRPGWPSFEASMDCHVRRTCLRGIARNMARARWQGAPIAPGLPPRQRHLRARWPHPPSPANGAGGAAST